MQAGFLREDCPASLFDGPARAGDGRCGLGTKATAEKYRVSADRMRKLKRFRRQTGSFAARQQRVSHATKLDDQLQRLQQLVQQRPDATLRELREALGVPVALGTVWRAQKRLQISFKKK